MKLASLLDCSTSSDTNMRRCSYRRLLVTTFIGLPAVVLLTILFISPKPEQSAIVSLSESLPHRVLLNSGSDTSLPLTHTKGPQFNMTDLHRQFAFSVDGPQDVLVFLHMQKTGGTFFGKNLVMNLDLPNPPLCDKENNMLKCPCTSSDGQRTWLFSRYSTGWKCGLHADFTELTECLASGKMDHLEDMHRYRRYLMFSVIRDPMERYISEWLHVQRGASWLGATLRCNGKSPDIKQLPFCFSGDSWENVTLETFLDCPHNLAHNRQTRMLANLSLVECYEHNLLDDPIIKEKMLQSAKDNIRAMPYFAIMKYANESQFLFEHTFGLKFKKPFYIQSVKRKHQTKELLTNLKPSLRQRVAQHNDLDIQLYEYAEQLFLQRYAFAQQYYRVS